MVYESVLMGFFVLSIFYLSSLIHEHSHKFYCDRYDIKSKINYNPLKPENKIGRIEYMKIRKLSLKKIKKIYLSGIISDIIFTTILLIIAIIFIYILTYL